MKLLKQKPWKLCDYSPEPEVEPIRGWYEHQRPSVQAEFDNDLKFFSSNEDWTEAYEVEELTGRYLGLYEIVTTIDDEGEEAQFGAIGAWRADTNVFVLFLVCDRYSNDSAACLEKAFQYKLAWDRGEGSYHEHEFF